MNDEPHPRRGNSFWISERSRPDIGRESSQHGVRSFLIFRRAARRIFSRCSGREVAFSPFSIRLSALSA